MELRRTHAFVVRLWQDRREVAGAVPEWRGRIEHVQSGDYAAFRDLSAIGPFIRRCLECPDAPGPAERGPGGDSA